MWSTHQPVQQEVFLNYRTKTGQSIPGMPSVLEIVVLIVTAREEYKSEGRRGPLCCRSAIRNTHWIILEIDVNKP